MKTKNMNTTQNSHVHHEHTHHEHNEHEHEQHANGHGHCHQHSTAEHEHGHKHSPPHAHIHEMHHHDHLSAGDALSGTVLTVRASSGLSGDMMLGGLAAIAGLTKEQIDELVAELKLPALQRCLTLEERFVNQVAGVGCQINLPHEHAHRTLADIKDIIAASAMPDTAKSYAQKAFEILAEAEAAVHGKVPAEVSFHEVGALDSILDTCMVCRIYTIINPEHFICSPLPLADGVVHCAHGHVPSPAPAVLRLLSGIPVTGFNGKGETVTPTAISLLKALGASFGKWPNMQIEKTVISYGSKVFKNAPNGAVWACGQGVKGY